MSNIFQIKYIRDNEIIHNYVFMGNTGEKNLGDKNTTYIDKFIYRDESISSIKEKIMKYTDLEYSTNEMYLFTIKDDMLDPNIAYNQITQSNSFDMTYEIYCDYLSNLSTDIKLKKCSIDDTKKIFTYEDLLSNTTIVWNSNNKFLIALGQEVVLKKKYPFIINPYNIRKINPIIQKKEKKKFLI